MALAGVKRILFMIIRGKVFTYFILEILPKGIYNERKRGVEMKRIEKSQRKRHRLKRIDNLHFDEA